MNKIIIDIEDMPPICTHNVSYHEFNNVEIDNIRVCLLEWYYVNRRYLPWRGDPPPYLKCHGDDDHDDVRTKKNAKRPKVAHVTPYGVWVSEVMCQQTQVQTVVKYYLAWMRRFPSIKDLAEASEEEVNELWAGLGYYRRARHLHAGAKKVMNDFGGVLPTTAKELLTIPGIGAYTAGAIASIAFNKPEGVVDGNVIRVFSRVRGVACSAQKKQAVNLYWKMATTLVDPQNPGDFNQSLMELGARVCTPRNPDCDSCPLQVMCHAYMETKRNERPVQRLLNDGTKPSFDLKASDSWCKVCEESFVPTMVTDYPRPKQKKQRRQEHRAVCATVCVSGDECKYLLVLRENGGLLSGQWECPSADVRHDSTRDERRECVDNVLQRWIGCLDNEWYREQLTDCIIHDFTHIRQHMHVSILKLPSCVPSSDTQSCRWFTQEDMQKVGITAGVLKVISHVRASGVLD